ncbi:response regulator [Paenibacillus thermoaerophilus]|uniref:Response regulator n=1 Tax=Paenibacillus thermoaerophilus TaxID=1215385 RepID=A0ABW2V272_9BACL|nr:response regulator [Paenibacillus thermoaerophilus]TMV11165.1 response regulator [Paenibacillus thermoaerophilus]
MNMKVMIVEDEPRVRKGLSEAVEWEAHGMELVAAAENGLDGYQLFCRFKPDLILVDVRMPVMDGLSMTEKVLEEQPNTIVIVLTGYDEFEYAQKSIRLGVRNYVLKPVGKQLLLEELLAAREAWIKERERNHDTERLREQMERQLPVLRSAFLEDWLTGTEYAAEQLEEKMSFLNLPLKPGDPASVAVFELDADRSVRPEDLHLYQFALHNIVSELSSRCGAAHMRGNGQQTVVVYQTAAGHTLNDMLQWAEKTKNEAVRFLKLSVTVGVSRRVLPLEQVPELFREAQQALRLKLSLGSGHVLVDDLGPPASEQLPLPTDSDLALLVHGVELNDELQLERIFNEFFHKVKRMNPPHRYPEELFFPFAGLYVSLAHRLGKGVRSALSDKEYALFRSPEQFASLDDMRDWLTERFKALSRSYEKYRKGRKVKLIEAVMDYVEAHIFDNITREDAAEHIHINSSYLSRLFREVTGEAFSDFVLRKKMEKAISLLQNEQALVYEVADRLGYKDSSYFARVFKKYTGRSPSDFS